MEDILDNGMLVVRTLMNDNIDLALTNGINNSFVAKIDGTWGIKE